MSETKEQAKEAEQSLSAPTEGLSTEIGKAVETQNDAKTDDEVKVEAHADKAQPINEEHEEPAKDKAIKAEQDSLDQNDESKRDEVDRDLSKPAAASANGDAEHASVQVKVEESATNRDEPEKDQAEPHIKKPSEEKTETVTKEPNGESKQDTAQKSSHPNQGPRKYKKNVKSDPSALEISDNPEEIRKQVEFYFSDSNLPQDKFLLDQVEGTKNLPVKITLLHSFKRMRRFQPYEAVVAALRESKILEVTENEEVRRKVPLDQSLIGKTFHDGLKKVEDRTLSRSIYAKGFGEETPTTQFDIEAFFQAHGPTNAIRLRRTFTQTFKGSVFVEFADDATQQAFLALDPKPKWKGQDLLIKSKKDYVEGKMADIEAGRIKPSRRIDQDDWKRRREQDQKSGFRVDKRGDHKGGRGRDGGRGRGRGRGGWGGNGRDRGRGGKSFRERDPHTIPKLSCNEPIPGDDHPATAPRPGQEAKPKETNANLERESPKENTTVTKVEASTEEPTQKPTPPSEAAAMEGDAASKKRAREADGEDQAARKKVDVEVK